MSDSPLPLALGNIVEPGHWLYHLLITVGLFGLVASFHGIILAAGRASMEFGRVRYAPPMVGNIHPRFKTPANALIINMGIGILALLTGETAAIITLSVFGALTLYIISMLSLIRLRKKEPDLRRPFKVPFYPVFPIIALAIAIISLLAMIVYNTNLAIIYVVIMAMCYLCFKFLKAKSTVTSPTK
jgi:ethanolamine permease